jgi:hypothetical protein
MTTDLEMEANYGIWRLEMAEGGLYRVEVHMDGGRFGKSQKARYLVAHAGATDEVVIDQSASPDDFVLLGDFDFAAGGEQNLMLGDNTGEGGDAEKSLLFDAVRVTPEEDEAGGSGLLGGCSAAGGGSGGACLVLVVFVGLLSASRRRRRSR